MNRVRLLCVMPSIPLGGMERAVVQIVSKIKIAGAQVHFIADQRWGTEVQKAIAAIGSAWSGVSFTPRLGLPRTPVEAQHAIRSWFVIGHEYKKIFDSYHPTHLLCTSQANAWHARQLAQREDVISIFRLPNPPYRSKNRVKKRIDKHVWHSIGRTFDHLVCNANYTAECLANVLNNRDKVAVIRNFMPKTREVTPSDAPVLDPAKLNIAYLGQISRSKGVDILFDVARAIVKNHDNVNFILAGPDVWKDDFGPDLRRRCEEEALTSRIHLIGRIEDTTGFFRQCDIHVCPSVSPGESFPNVVLEAKQAGIPSVVFPTAGLPEAVTHKVDGMICAAATSENLETQLRQLIDDPALRQRLAQGATSSTATYDDATILAEWARILGVRC